MNETKPQWEPTGLERFGHLEDKIYRFVEEYRVLQRENETLRTESAKFKEEIKSLHEKETASQENLMQLNKEREELRERVEKALSLLTSLEAR
jgi:uncharacterized coiled-coil DUF342 family protein